MKETRKPTNRIDRRTELIYAPWHPLNPNPPTPFTRAVCYLSGHSFVVSDWHAPDFDLLCMNCSLYTSIQYLRIPKPPVTLPDQNRARQH